MQIGVVSMLPVLAWLCAIAFASTTARGHDVAVYDLPPIYEPSKVFTLKVNGKAVPVVSYVGDYDYAHFSMGDGPANVEITVQDRRRIEKLSVSPWKLGIRPAVQGNRIRFTLERDEYLIIKADGVRALVLLADPPETDVPDRQGEGVFDVRSAQFGADPTGERYATKAIQAAIDAASAYGGEHGQGVVYVPRGVYLVGNLALKSNSALYLEGGAVLRCTTDAQKLTPHWFKNSKQSHITWWLYTPDGAENVKVFGRGTLDGNGWNLWESNKNGERRANNILVPMHASGFTFDGLIVRESSAWSVKPVRSDNLIFTNLKMLNRLNMSENDGIDVVESQNVVVRNAIGIALDDPFSFKTWAETTDIALTWTGEPEPNENILVERALSWTHCYGYKVGQGVLQPQRNITVRDSVVYDAAVALGIHHRYGDAPASEITFENIEIERQHGTNDGKGNWLSILVDHRNPLGGGLISNVHLKNITVHDAGRTPAMLRGISDTARIVGVTFDNIMMPQATRPAQNMHELNLTNRDYHEDVTILPVQTEEPPVRNNIARGRNATASSYEKNDASKAFDGDLNTRWGSERSDPQWIAVDLGEPQSINGVKIAWEVAYARSYRIEVSHDGRNWRPVYRTNAGQGMVEEINFAPVRARYVRVFATQRGTQYGYSIWEFEVYPTGASAQ